MSAFEISVILAEAPGQPDLQPTLASIERACAGLSAEVLVVRPAGRPPWSPGSANNVRELTAGEATLVPERWGVGVLAATAPVFACLTSEFTVHAAWARSLLDALATGAVGAAGAIELARGADATAAATYLVRFSPYLPGPAGRPRQAANIPGDTAAYQREAVLVHADLLTEGFWEIEFHRRFANDGKKLILLQAPLATYSTNRGLAATLLLRYRHGREFGATRVVMHRHSRWRLVLASPIVPVVLVTRIFGRLARVPRRIGLAVRAFPALVMISAAWAAGEAAGAWSARDPR